ncbi:hypothetical protein ACN28S_58275 [Cystobacter fuscus]
MGRFASAWAVILTVTLWALPAGATVLELYRPLAPPPTVPDQPVFDELLFSLADPERALAGGLTVPSLDLAIRARAWGFIPATQYEQRAALDSLSEPMKNLTMSELPAGRQLVSLLALGPDGEQVRLRDLGPRLSGPDSLLQRGLDSTLGFLRVPKPVAIIAASAAALGLLHQFGTRPADDLGVPISLSGTLLNNRLNTSVRLSSGRHFQNARADISLRWSLPEISLRTLRLEQLELGGAAARTAEGLLLDTRWANLRGRLSWLEFCLGVHSSQAEPALWTVLETGVRRENFSVHTLLSHQWETARLRLMATATLRTGQVMSGFFVGSQDRVKHTFGLIGMGTF